MYRRSYYQNRTYIDKNQLKDDLLKINFGDLDGRSDPNLSYYFFDRDYWKRIVKGYKYFVIGRKGTGKSALYTWLKDESYKSNCICHNILFNALPMGQLLKLSDDTFLKPNQYQTICANMILSEFCKIIIEDGEYEVNSYSDNIRYYNNLFGNNIDNCFKKSVSVTSKTKGKLGFGDELSAAGFSLAREQTDLFDLANPNLQTINAVLEDSIISYLKSYSKEKKFLIQIDGVDENYNQITSMTNQVDDYLSLIISLMKTVYSINQKIHMECADMAKCIVYLRSDILERIHGLDPESARWIQQSEFLNWSITHESSWYNNDLRNLIKTRMDASLKMNSAQDVFEYIFNPHILRINQGQNKYVKNIFEYMTIRSFHRPRDIIQFCICFQNEVRNSNNYSWKEFKDAEKQYSLWFLDEIKNEISPLIKDTDELFSMLRSLGSKPFAISVFKSTYMRYQEKLELDGTDLLNYLYEVGIVYNVSDNGRIFTSMRNDQSKLNKDMKIALHAGFWKGLYTSTY